MPVPTFDQFIEPLLSLLAEREEALRCREAYEIAADRMGLTEADRAEMLPSGRQATYKNRIAWAQDRLKRAGLSTSPRHGYWTLTPEGRAFAEKHTEAISPEIIKVIALTKFGAEPKGDRGNSAASNVKEGELSESQTPEERLLAAYEEIRERTRGELLDRIHQASPAFFERLVLDLLHAMGYGARRDDLAGTGAGADGGIDGIVSLDRLGLEKVYVQAKRYAQDKVVSRPALQGFYGALAGRHARKGVFITTSRFSKAARDYAGTVSDNIVLVNGHQLAAYMIDFGVGTTHKDAYVMASIDGDYFDEP